MRPLNRCRTFLSIDITLAPSKKEELFSILQARFPGEFVQDCVVAISKKDYRKKIGGCDQIVVWFAGYSMKRYFNNLIPHLLWTRKKLWGINIDGHIFKIPRFRVFWIVSRYRLQDFLWSFLLR